MVLVSERLLVCRAVPGDVRHDRARQQARPGTHQPRLHLDSNTGNHSVSTFIHSSERCDFPKDPILLSNPDL